jgi:thiol-disulfide isomerase/thioredoxin
MRAPVDTIAAPLFPSGLPWVNARGPQATIQRGRPMLVEFWDFCRPNSLRTLPYLKAWHERYGPHAPAAANGGLRVIGVHCPGFEPSRDPAAVRAAVARLGITYPVLIDSELQLWSEYENAGWPARYLFDGRARLFDYHYGEGAYAETELAIQELIGVQLKPLEPLRPEDAPGARVLPQTVDQPGAYTGPYEAGGVWAVLSGSGSVSVTHRPPSARAQRAGPTPAPATITRELRVTQPGAYPLIEHAAHTSGVLETRLHGGLVCHATCFTPGVDAG